MTAYTVANIRRMTRQPYLARFDVRLPGGFTLCGCTLLSPRLGEGKPHVLLPRVPDHDDDGEVVRGDGGKVAFMPVLKFPTEDEHRQFRREVRAALRREAPQLFEQG